MHVSDGSTDLQSLRRFASSFWECVNTPRALSCHLLMKYGEWDQLVDRPFSPVHDYIDAKSFDLDYQAVSLMKKAAILPTSFDRRERAKAKFKETELACAATNIRLQTLLYGSGVGVPKSVFNLAERARRRIHKLLGSRLSEHDFSVIRENMRYGPGSTTSISGDVTYGRKYTNRLLDGTPDQIHHTLFLALPGLKKTIDGFRVVNGSKCIFVPKDAKTHRSIAKEPDCGILLQKGIAALLRRRMRPWLDLERQADVNRSLAARAFIDGLATIDLSSASDTVSQALVLYMLPTCWSELLKAARTPSIEIDGELIHLEKWSSMGNGYTFELETLIFMALALEAADSVDDHRGLVGTFGDDIIVPQEAAPILIETLEFLGFSVNLEKTFLGGSFFESCGADFFQGRPVRPFFVRKTDFSVSPQPWYILANRTRLFAERQKEGFGADVKFLPAWVRCFTAVKPAWRLKTPLELGDVGFTVSV